MIVLFRTLCVFLFDVVNVGQNIFDNVDDPQRLGAANSIMTPPRTAQHGVRLQF